MAEKRRGLGRGLGALIPSAPTGDARPVDVFFPGASTTTVERSDRPVEHDDEAKVEHDAATTPAGPVNPVADVAHAVPTADDNRQVDAHADEALEGAQETPPPPPHGDPLHEHVPAPDHGSDLITVPGAHFAEVPVDSITPNPRQPRTVFDEDALAELVGSIREVGVLQPVVVRPLPADADGRPRFELIMGERRWRASQRAGLDRIPAIVRETEDDVLLRDALLENLHRSQLNALEEAAAYQQLLDDFGCTHEELAQRIHRSRPQISNTLRLLRLPPLVQRRVAAGVLSAGHARALLGLEDGAAMERLAQRIVAEGLSVRATEEIVTLGGEPSARVGIRRPRAGDRNAALDDLASRLSDRFETRVKIALGRSKGRLTVEFASVQDLNRILTTLSPDDPGLLR